MDSVTAWKPLLLTLLKDRPPEPAARLMQSLVSRGNTVELGGFDYKRLGFKRFRNFLEACADILHWDVDAEGTMLVSLRKATETDNEQPAMEAATRRVPAVRGDIWIAFANPDPLRVRYFNRSSGSVFHHKPGNAEITVNKPGPDWIPIKPVEAVVQQSWMREFVAATPGIEADAFPMLNVPYRTEVNADFTKALGPDGNRWRKYRTTRMIDAICRWAQQSGVDLSLLCPIEPRTSASQPPMPRPVESATTEMSAKERALKLLEALTDDEIAGTLVPLMASIIMVKSHR